jgi:hypothetical protein
MEIEVYARWGPPEERISVVGLPDTAVKGSTGSIGSAPLGSREPLIKVLSRFEDLIDMVLRPKTQPLHLVYQRAP